MTQRSQIARMGALAKHAKHDPRPLMLKANKAFMESFERKVDPDGVLEPGERARRAEMERRLHFQRMAYASAKARRKGAA